MVTVAPQLDSTSSPSGPRRERLAGFAQPLRKAGALAGARRCAALLFAAAALAAPLPGSADVFVDLGAQSTRVEAKIALVDEEIESTDSGLHLGIGASRPVGARSEIGVRLELDDVDSDLLLAVRAFDYRRHLNDRFAVGAFIGAARLDLATPAYGYYLGGGVQLKEIMPGWDVSLDLRFGDKVARDNLLPEDPQGGSPDNFYDLTSVSLYLRRRF